MFYFFFVKNFQPTVGTGALNPKKLVLLRNTDCVNYFVIASVSLKIGISLRFGLKSRSFGKGDDRHLTISRKFDATRYE